MSTDVFKEDNHTCPICHEDIKFYGYGGCNHPACAKCAIKLRLFEDKAGDFDYSSCATCRQKLGKILIMTSLVPFKDVVTSSLIHDTEHDLIFETQEARQHFVQLTECRCLVCGDLCQTMSALNRHCSNVHRLTYCDLCMANARMLPGEFTPMKNDELIAHRKWVKDKAKGHPMCKFCERRFYDFEELITHVRENHFSCDICQRQRLYFFFRTQSDMWQHSSEKHHVCEECQYMQKTMIFAEERDLAVHMAREHPQSRGRIRLEDTLITVDFNRDDQRGGRGSGRGRGRGRDRESPVEEEAPRQPVVYCENPEDFPSLGGHVAAFRRPMGAEVAMATVARGDDVRYAFAQHRREEAKTTSSAASTTSQPITTNSSMATNVALYSNRSAGRIVEKDFPALGNGAAASTQKQPVGAWGKKANPTGTTTRPTPVTQTNPVPMSGDDFPGLPAASRPMGSARPWAGPSSATPFMSQASGVQKKSAKKAKSSQKKSSYRGFSDDDDDELVKIQPPSSTFTLSDLAAELTRGVSNEKRKAPLTQSREENAFVTPRQIKNGPALECDDFPTLPAPQTKPFSFSSVPSSFTESAGDSAIVHCGPTISPPPTQTQHRFSKPPKIASKDEFPSLAAQPKPDNPMASQSKGKKNPQKPRSDKQTSGNRPRDVISLRDLSASLTKAVFVQPPGFEARNVALISDIKECLGDLRFDDFAEFARRYRQRMIDGNDFMRACHRLLSAPDQRRCLPEMVALLPDIGLQKTILDELPAPLRRDLRECSLCGQVCTHADFQHHQVEAHT